MPNLDDHTSQTVTISWQRYTDWLQEYMPLAYANLAPGATPDQLAQVAAVTGHNLPPDVQALLSVNNGQLETTLSTVNDVADSAEPAFPITNLLSTDCIIDEWRGWREIAEEVGDYPGIGAVLAPDQDKVKPLYTSRHWVPLLNAELRSDYFGLDFEPGPAGTAGQIINFGRDEETHYVAAPDFTTLIRLVTEAVMADGPATPDPPVKPPPGTHAASDDDDADGWAYWGDEFRQPWESLYQNRFSGDGPNPDVVTREDFPDPHQYRQS